MTDDEKPTSITDDSSENGEGWVVTTNYTMRRAPGILDTPDTTYVAPPRRIPRRTLIIGCAIALASIAIGTGLVLAADQGGDDGLGESEVSAAATLTSTTTLPAPTTTTAPPPPPSTAPKQTTATTAAPPSGGAVPAAVPTPTPTPPATANPALGPYQPVPVPVGVSATLTACAWGGGQLQAGGTITSHAANGRTWTVTMHWLQGGRALAAQGAVVDLAPGESKPWGLVLPFDRPADLACSLEIS